MATATDPWYRQHAAAYARETLAVDMAPQRARFLARLPVSGARILDAGCGAGRDARAFRDLGHVATAFDACPELAALATAHLGRPVAVLRFEDLDVQAAFDGIWACASLLHVPLAGLPAVFDRLHRALRPGGVLYASFKYGQGERVAADGRRFTDLDEAGLQSLLAQSSVRSRAGSGGWHLLEQWQSDDARPGRPGRWLNLLLGR